MRLSISLVLMSLATLLVARDVKEPAHVNGFKTTDAKRPLYGPATTFFLRATLPKSAGGGGVINPFSGNFYTGFRPFPFCGTGKQDYCDKNGIPGKPVFAKRHAIDGSDFMWLNTSTRYPDGPPGSSKLAKQNVYVDAIGQMRFLKPPAIALMATDHDSNFTIVHGSNGKPDTLQFSNSEVGGFAPFYSCLIDKTYSFYQIFIGIPAFKQTGCVKFEPEVHYSTNGALEWE